MPPTRTLPPLPHRDDIAPQKAVKQCAGKCRIHPADGDKLQRQPSPPPPLIHISPRTYSRSCNVITRMRSSCMPACHGEKELQNAERRYASAFCFSISSGPVPAILARAVGAIARWNPTRMFAQCWRSAATLPLPLIFTPPPSPPLSCSYLSAIVHPLVQCGIVASRTGMHRALELNSYRSAFTRTETWPSGW